MVSFDHYQHELHKQLQQASERGAKSIVITAAELNLAVGGKPGFMDSCFEALQCEIGPDDEVLIEPDGGTGLAVRFSLPRLA
ncbi:hypothetical protein FNL55_16085 [Tardiphaga sp. vice352]|uniref:hypothetical protein n=1 Tax=Tardiphaga sp. vice352 TaxID=2592816 RepID=UPI0011638E5E|nr:hypothetical protein [Tardiphaga sp. vice352]QDM32699.1 hypothetical protein FNL55_16085 [Tardiphaga sp. vice352]